MATNPSSMCKSSSSDVEKYASAAKKDVGIKALLFSPGKVCWSEDNRGCHYPSTIHLVPMLNVGVACTCSGMCGGAHV